jgi:hypothetical protein
VATLTLAALAMAPATLLALQPRMNGEWRLSVPAVSLLAAVGIVALLGLSRAGYRETRLRASR